MRFLHILTLAAGLMSTSAHAAILFDFEGTADTGNTGALTSLTQTKDGLSVTFTRPGDTFDIRDLTAFGGPASFGRSSLNPFFTESNATPFVANFSRSLSALSFQAGDFAQDSDTIQLALYSGTNGTGSLVGTTSVDYGFGSLPNDVATVAFSGSPFESAVFIGGSPSFPNSVYYDNFSATLSTVPLPASAPMFGAALLALGAVGYGVKRKKAAVFSLSVTNPSLI